ncbi:hypothetical protein VTK73DRAFT_4177 [Phialemonium thermophilum]|uniref:Secreted protein n=1 Tax=Phialemonium thermophilum TaxID=223376 RepID=A0ABR3XZG2_9PEZI
MLPSLTCSWASSCRIASPPRIGTLDVTSFLPESKTPFPLRLGHTLALRSTHRSPSGSGPSYTSHPVHVAAAGHITDHKTPTLASLFHSSSTFSNIWRAVLPFR